jgi:micrococcal nuclease
MSLKKTNSARAISRRKRSLILLLCLPMIALLVLLDNTIIKHTWQSGPLRQEQAKTSDLDKYHAKTFAVTNVIDGDTLDIDVPDGRNKHTRIRLLGIDAPETHAESGPMYFGPQAAEFAAQCALARQVEVYLDQTSETRGKYGRLLAYVKLPDGRFLNEVLLAEGLAYADLRFRHSLYNKYKQIESRARAAKKGLWQNVTSNQLPDWLVGAVREPPRHDSP